MACFISYRAVTFTPAANAVTIVVTTNIPSHDFIRVSATAPQVHRKSATKRGYPFVEDLRFCFTSFNDHEQQEPGDTTTHTFLIPDWPYCVTKWFYLWGSIDGETCVSTSPTFEYHNTYSAPPEPVLLFSEDWEWWIVEFGAVHAVMGEVWYWYGWPYREPPLYSFKLKETWSS